MMRRGRRDKTHVGTTSAGEREGSSTIANMRDKKKSRHGRAKEMERVERGGEGREGLRV